MRSRIGAALIATLLWTLAAVAPAHAAFPGRNGKIAFSRVVRNAGDLFTIDPDGTDETNITNSSSSEGAPTWSPDGRRLAFSGDVGAEIMNADGSGTVTRLTSPIFPGQPAWAPDGHHLVVQLIFNVCAGFCPEFLAVYDAPGHYLAITPVDDASYEADPVWSPNGDKIAYVSNADRLSENASSLYLINPDGTGRVRLTDAPGSDAGPDWSPDGRQIVFTSTRDRGNPDIYAIDANGSNLRRLTNTSGVERYPVWSPDGKKILFERARDDDNGRYTSDIYEINANGSGERLVVRDAQFPDWQPVRGPQRSDYKNAAQFCNAERRFLGEAAFTNKYGGGANAYGKCVSAQ